MKFRSWEKDKKEFVYFEDGIYSQHTSINGRVKYYEPVNLDSTQISYFWSNAEQEVNIDNNKYYIGDIGVIKYLEHDPKTFSIYGNGCDRVRILKGVVGFDYSGLFIQDDKNCYYISDYKGRANFKVIGNIHENKEK